MKKKRILSALLVVMLLMGTMAACAPNVPQVADVPAQGTGQASTQAAQTVPNVTVPQEIATDTGGEITLAIATETPSVAPARHISAVGSMKNLLTHNALFRMNYADLEPVPDLVVSYHAINDELWEFTLREGVMFHNGEEMTAYDVEASFHYARTFTYGRTAHLSAIDIEVVDRYTFRLHTDGPQASLLIDLTHQANMVMPKSLLDAGHDFNVDPIGSGPFVFEEWRSGDSLTFTAFDNYFDTDRAARMEVVNWRIIPEGASRTIALEMGEVDYIVEVAFPDIPRLEANPDVTLFYRTGIVFNFIILNNERPQFSNFYARKAINMAVDQELLVAAAFDGRAVPIREQLPPVFPGVVSDGVVPFDPEGARALLAEQGIDPESLAFEMLVSTEERRRMAEVVQAQMADIGIPTTITQLDHAANLAAETAGEHEAGFAQWGGSFLISTLRGVWHTEIGGRPNRSRIRNEEITNLIDLGSATLDENARIAVFEEMSRLTNEYVGNIPTHMNLLFRAFDANLSVPETSAAGCINLNMIYWRN